MKLTFKEVLERAKSLDEVTLLELLEISSEDLVDRFEDKVEDKLFMMEIEVTFEEEEDENDK